MALETLLNIGVGLVGGETVVRGLSSIGAAAVDTAVKADRMTAMMEATSGSSQEAARNLQFVTEAANKMGLEIYSSTNAYNQLLAATRGTVLEGQATQQMFESLAAANTKLGGSTADLTGMLNSFTQMISKGTVSMEELRGQLGERLPGAMKMAADAMGITTEALIEQVSSGSVLAEDLLPRLAEAINRTYNDGKFDTASANINRLSNSWEEFKRNITSSDWVNAVLTNVEAAISGINRLKNATTSQKIFDLESKLKFWQESDAFTRTILTTTGRGVDEKQTTQELERLRAQLSQESNQQPTSRPAVTSAYVTQTKEFVEKHETDKLKIIQNARQKELRENEQAWARAIRTQQDNANEQLKITEAFRQREAAINKQYDDKQKQEMDRLAKPGLRAQAKADKAAEREAAKSQREYESMVERARDLISSYEDDFARIVAKTNTNAIKQINDLAEAEKKSQLDKLINAKLSGQQYEEAYAQLQENIAQIDKKAEFDKTELKRKTNNTLLDYENSLKMDVAKLSNDRLSELKLIYEAETKAAEDAYNEKVRLAQNSEVDIANITRAYNQRKIAIDKRYTENTTRINGSYLDKLALKFRDTYSSQDSIVNEFTDNAVDLTMRMSDSLANSFAQLATSGKASWADLSNSVIMEIEKMIGKMMAMWAVQQLIGLAGSFIGGETGGLMRKSAGMDPFNGSGPWMSFQNAKGNVFENGSIVPFADGGVVRTPTNFPMSGGNVGLMGEAGTEAIMPLSRDASGRLGVRSAGGNSVTVGAINVTVSNGGNNPEQTGKIVGSAVERQIKQLVQMQVKESFRPGNMMNQTKTVGGGVAY